MSDEFAQSQEFLSPSTARQVLDTARGVQRTVKAEQNAPKPITLEPEPKAQGPAMQGDLGRVANVRPGMLTNAAGWMGFAGFAPMGLMLAPLANKIPQGFGHVAKWVGAKDFGEKRIANAAKRDEAFEKWSDRTMDERFGVAQSPTLKKIGDGMEGTVRGFDNMTGLSKWRGKRLDAAIGKGTGKWASAADAFGTQLEHATKTTGVDAAHIAEAKTHLDALKTAMSKDGSKQAINEARVGLGNALDKIYHGAHGKSALSSGVVSAVSDAVTGSFTMGSGDRHIDKLPTSGLLSRFTRWIKLNKAPGEAADAKGAATNLMKEFGHLNRHAGRAADLHAKKGFWGDFSGSFKNLGERVGEMSTIHVATNAGVAIANLAMNIHSLHSFRSQLHQFEAIYQGITGQECSMWTALMGNVPPVLKHAQKELLYGGMREAGMNGVITGVDTALFFMKHGYMPMMAVQMVGTSLRDGMACEVPLVQVEQAMTDAQKKGMKLLPAHYAQLLQIAAPDTIGHVKSTNTMFVKLCNKLANEQWTALKVLQAVNDNSINKMAADIQQELATKGRKPGEVLPEAPLANAATPATAEATAVVNTTAPAAPVMVTPSTKQPAIPTVPMTKIESMNAVHIPPASRTAAII